MAVMTNKEYLFSLAVHGASFGPPVGGRAQNADRQKLKFDALMKAIKEAKSKGNKPPHHLPNHLPEAIAVVTPDGDEAEARVTKLDVYSAEYLVEEVGLMKAAMIVGTAIIPAVVLPGDGSLSPRMRDYLESVLDRIFKVKAEGFNTDDDLLPYTWVIVPVQELSEGILRVGGMGGATGG